MRTLSQFLLYDDGPPFGQTFQSGLGTRREGQAGAGRLRVRAVAAVATVRRGGRLHVWGLLRAAPRLSARIAYRVGSGAWKTLATARSPDGPGES